VIWILILIRELNMKLLGQSLIWMSLNAQSSSHAQHLEQKSKRISAKFSQIGLTKETSRLALIQSADWNFLSFVLVDESLVVY